MFESYLTGLVVCGGIIVAIGAQNAYVLSQAIRREHHWWSAGLCMTSDILLFTLGMFGVSAALMAMPEALDVLRWLGVAFLGLLVGAGVLAGTGPRPPSTGSPYNGDRNPPAPRTAAHSLGSSPPGHRSGRCHLSAAL